jgi:hypothetical protein
MSPDELVIHGLLSDMRLASPNKLPSNDSVRRKIRLKSEIQFRCLEPDYPTYLADVLG